MVRTALSKRGARSVASGAQGLQQLGAVRRTPAGAGIPARLGVVAAVVAAGDVVRAPFAQQRTVQHRVEEADRMAELLVHQRDQAGPQRRDGAGAADDEVLAIDPYF